MWYLLTVTLIWAFSFGIIKKFLPGLDETAVAAVRMLLALIVFLPFLRVRKISRNAITSMAFIGAVQFGAMYVFYLHAFKFLEAYEVAFFTIFTPLYMILLDAALNKHTNRRHLVAALLSIVAAAIVSWKGLMSEGFMTGFLCVQFSNLCFAAGQIAYVRIRPKIEQVADAGLYGWMLLGASAITIIFSIFTTEWTQFCPTSSQWLWLVYLGTLASGVGFFLWNRGALRVNTGTLAAFNNAKIPAAVLCSLLFFMTRQVAAAEIWRLAASLALMFAAIGIAQRGRQADWP